MKVYLDLVFFVNIAFDFLLLLTVKIILKRNIKLYRVFLGSIVGAISIVFLFLPLNSFTLFLLKIVVSILMILVTFGYKDKNYFIKNILYLYFISILLGGFLYYLNVEFSYKNVGLIFFHNGFSINFILLLILSPIILYLYIKQNRVLGIHTNLYYEVDIYYKKHVFHYQGYLDTGNKLYDPYFHKPIMLLYDLSFPILTNPIYVPYKTLEHDGLLPCIKVDKVILDGDKVLKNVYIGLSKDKFSIEGVEMILHQDLVN